MNRRPQPTFGDLLAQHCHRRQGLSQSKLAAGIGQDAAVISAMCHGRRLQGRQSRERVVRIIDWFFEQAVLDKVEEANALLWAAGKSGLNDKHPLEAALLQRIEEYQEAQPRIDEVRPRHAHGHSSPLASRVAGTNARTLPLRRAVSNPRDAVRLDEVVVGREAALSTFATILERAEAQQGEGDVVFVGGPAGIGKTTFLGLCATIASREGALVLRGRCGDEAGPHPYGPWPQIVENFARSQTAANAFGQTRIQLDDLMCHLVGPVELAPELPPAPINSQITGGFDTLAILVETLLRTASEARPAVLILDDLHEADADSLRMLKEIGRRLRDQPLRVIVICAYREPPVNSRLADCLARLEAFGWTRHIDMEPLTVTEVSQYINATTGLQPPGAVVAEASNRTGGNPLFLVHLVRDFKRRGLMNGDSRVPWIRDVPLPASVTGMLLNRFALATSATPLLAVAAVVGLEFEAEVVGRTLDLAESELLRQLDDACAEGIIHTCADGGSFGRYSFDHPLSREAIYDSIPSSERRRSHARVASVLAGLYGHRPCDQLADIVHHFVKARDLLDEQQSQQLTAYAEQAARWFNSRFAYDEATRYYDLLLQLHRSRQPVDDAIVTDLLLERGRAEAKAGLYESARATFDEAADMSRRAGRAAHYALAVLGSMLWKGVGMGSSYVFYDQDTVDRLSACLQTLDDAGPHLASAKGESGLQIKAKLLSSLALELQFQPDSSSWQKRTELFDQAIECARASDDRALEAFVLSQRRAAQWSAHNVEERLEVSNRLVQLAADPRVQDWQLQVEGSIWLVIDQLDAAQLDAARASLERLDRLVTQLGQPYYKRWPPALRATFALAEGDWEGANSYAQIAALAEAAINDPRYSLDQTYAVKDLIVLRERGEVAQMEETIRALIASYVTVPAWRVGLALLLCDVGRIHEARAQIDLLMPDEVPNLPRDPAWMVGMCLLAEVCAQVGTIRQCENLFRGLARYADSDRVIVASLSIGCFGAVARPVGLLAAALGQHDLADRLLERALTLHERWGWRPWILRTRYDRLRLHIQCGAECDKASRAAQVSSLISEARASGMVRLEEQASGLLNDVRGTPTAARGMTSTSFS